MAGKCELFSRTLQKCEIVMCSVQRLHLTALYQADWSVYSVEEQELLLLLMCNDLDGIFDLFADKGTNAEGLVYSSTTFGFSKQEPLPAISDIDAVYSRCIPCSAPKRAKHLSPPRDATTPLHGLKEPSFFPSVLHRYCPLQCKQFDQRRLQQHLCVSL